MCVFCQLLMYRAKNLYFPGFPGNRPSGNGIPGKYESGTYDNPSHDTRVHGETEKNLNLLNWPLLETRRARVKLHLLHKAKSQSIEIPTTDLDWEEAPPQISINRTSTRSSRLNYPIHHSNVNSHLHSFFPSTVRLWNSLPEEVQSLKSYSSFQQTLKSTHISRTYTTL